MALFYGYQFSCTFLFLLFCSFQSKLEETTRDLTAQITELQEESKQYRDREEHYLKFIRELEQKNDDLERLQRFVSTIRFISSFISF